MPKSNAKTAAEPLSRLEETILALLKRELPPQALSAAKKRQLFMNISLSFENAAKDLPTAKKKAPAAPGIDISLLDEISRQIGEIEITTEEAANTIMELAEKHLDQLAHVRKVMETARNAKAKDAALARVREHNAALHHDLMAIITAASFHDLAVQRSRKISAAVEELKATPGAAAKSPAKASKKKAPAESAAASELKGPVLDVSQDSIDDLLAQLGS